jgi:hypothetical protein
MGRPAAWIAADVVRFEDGILKEHWDVLQDEATKAAFPCLATHSPTERRLGTEPIRSLLLYLIDLIIPGLRPNRAGQKPKEALNACTSNLSLRW